MTCIRAITGREANMKAFIAVVIAFANGITVGSGLVSFLAIIGLVPRLAEVTHTERNLRYYEITMVCASTLAALEPAFYLKLYLPAGMTIIPGVFMGLFVGCLAAALAEVLNVLPVMARRVGLLFYIRFFLLSMIIGKVAGSLVYWIISGF